MVQQMEQQRYDTFKPNHIITHPIIRIIIHITDHIITDRTERINHTNHINLFITQTKNEQHKTLVQHRVQPEREHQVVHILVLQVVGATTGQVLLQQDEQTLTEDKSKEQLSCSFFCAFHIYTLF